MVLKVNSVFLKDLSSGRKLPVFKITIFYFISSDNFVVNERCHM